MTDAEWVALAEVLTDAAGRAHPFSLAPRQLPAARADLLRAEAPRTVAGRLALLGDTAFVVRPQTAMGMAKAAGDAMALRRQLARLPLEAALQAYARERMPVGAELD